MIENPSVNRCLDEKGMDHLDHALGRPIFPLRETFRNHFATDASGGLAAEFEASAFWTKTLQRDDMAFFGVTQAGREALARHLAKIEQPWRPYLISFAGLSSVVPERTRGKAKYAYYLEVSDIWSDLTFADFCRRASVRSAA